MKLRTFYGEESLTFIKYIRLNIMQTNMYDANSLHKCFCFFSWKYIKIIVLLLDGNPEIGAHAGKISVI